MFHKRWKATPLYLILLEISSLAELNEKKEFCHQKDHTNEARRKEPLSGAGMSIFILKEPRFGLLRYGRDERLHEQWTAPH